MRARRPAAWVVAGLGLAFAVTVAPAATIFEASSPVPGLPISIRAAAMGGASAAVGWGEPDVWANPALLSGVHGVGWVAGHTKILPDIFDGVTLGSQRLLLGGAGLGFSFMGRPISGLGKTRFDYGSFFSQDMIEDAKGWGVGVSPLRLIDAFRGAAGSNGHALSRIGEISVGYHREVSSQTTGSGPEFEVGESYDWGITGRLALSRLWSPEGTFRLDLSAAYADLNATEPSSNFVTTRFKRSGVALRLSPAPPSERLASPPSLPWWRPGDVPELSLGLAYDHDERGASLGGSTTGLDHLGFEATVFHLLALRVGYFSDPAGEVEGVTYGGGLTLPLGPWMSAGYELADVPLADGVERQFRQGWSVWLDPARMFGASW